MSDKERPKIVANGVGGGEGGGTCDDEDDPQSRKCEECGKKGKWVSLFRRRKGKKVQNQRKKQKGSFVNSGCSARRGVLCFKKPQTLDSSGESPTSDPNSSEFTFDMLRAIIEKNEFYSKECNPHLDAADG